MREVELLPKRVLVTGGAGFIGSHFVEHLLRVQSIDRLVVLDALTYAGRRENLDSASGDARFVFVHGDVCDALLLRRLFREHAIDAVVHLAAESHVDRSIADAAPFVRTNVLGTVTLLDEARCAWSNAPSPGRFVHVSSDEVYGALGEHGRFTEASPYAPNSPYAASKASSDFFVRAYQRTYGFPAIITHCANNFGPRQAPEKLIPRLIARALAGEPLPVFGQGLQRREWLYVEDHCRALELALLRGALGETYNFAGTEERTNLETARALADAVDLELGRAPGTSRATITFVEDRPGHDFRYALDGDKARVDLGFEAMTRFDEGLARTVRWYVENRAWLSPVERLR
jgi:dTDP-glucose 4,6-dehydratase